MARRIPLSHMAGAAIRQGYHRIATDLGGPARSINLRSGRPGLFYEIRSTLDAGDPAQGETLLEGHFEYGGQRLDVGLQGDPWTIPAPSERYAFWLHSFEWLSDLTALKDNTAHVRARFLVDRWIEIFGKWNVYAWSPELLTHRLYAWMCNWSPTLQVDNLSDIAQIRRNVVIRQAKRLRKTYKHTPPGLTRLKAAATLTMVGARLGSHAESFLERGLDWLDDEIEVQILPDGGHISRSPEQTFQAVKILMVLDEMLQTRGVAGSRSLTRAIDRLLPVIPFFLATDGGLACFNGGSEGDKSLIARLMKSMEISGTKVGYCPHTHFQRIDQNGTVLLMDCGGSPPRPFDTQAHLAPLAFELSTDAGRMVVNCGWNAKQPASWRRMMRSTAAHSTVILNAQSTGRLLKDGVRTRWMGEAIDKDAGPGRAARKEQKTGIWLEASHDGYIFETGLAHRRRIYMDVDGTDIRGEDSLAVPIGETPLSREEIGFEIRFHLHPDVQVTLAQDMHSALIIQPGRTGWKFRTDSGPLTLEASTYLGAGSRPKKSEQIVISGRALCDSDGETRSNRVRWSFKRLDTKSS